MHVNKGFMPCEECLWLQEWYPKGLSSDTAQLSHLTGQKLQSHVELLAHAMTMLLQSHLEAAQGGWCHMQGCKSRKAFTVSMHAIVAALEVRTTGRARAGSSTHGAQGLRVLCALHTAGHAGAGYVYTTHRSRGSSVHCTQQAMQEHCPLYT
eukprot:1156183-Pelagomonas_calceolata.AAC.14